MEFRDAIRRRRMVRKFEQKPIPDEVLTRVLEVARHAPSGGFSQGFDFIVLAKPEELEWFYRTTDDPTDPEPFPGREPDLAPACLVLPFANKRLYLDRYAQADKIQFGMDKEENWPVPFWTVDTAMAIMLILLAAVNEGLGAWYFGITRGEADVVRELGVPPSCTMLGVIALGYPSSEDKPRGSVFTRRRRPFEEMFHIGRW
ncbi:MAG TPA: nitroreductase family protein [Candidatus Dormibacteraeota bacterium]